MFITSIRKIIQISKIIRQIRELFNDEGIKRSLASIELTRNYMQDSSENIKRAINMLGEPDIMGERRSATNSAKTFMKLQNFINDMKEIISVVRVITASFKELISELKFKPAQS